MDGVHPELRPDPAPQTKQGLDPQVPDSSAYPTYRPTLQLFSNVSATVEAIWSDPAFQAAGICKVVPPSGWLRFSTANYEGLSDESRRPDVPLVRPLIQAPLVLDNRRAILLNLEQGKPMTLDRFQVRHQSEEDKARALQPYRTVERRYWSSFTSCTEPAVYGADTPGTLFRGDPACGWNPDRLDNMLQLLPSDVLGVNRAMLYFGSWRASFAWHTEDVDLMSINYLHLGAPKFWYAIPPAHRQRFEAAAAAMFPDQHRECKAFLRHKACLITPAALEARGIPLIKLRHEPGEMIITGPGAYHAGFNYGFNIAESCNLACSGWIPIGRRSQKVRCKCNPDAVAISMDDFEALIIQHHHNNRLLPLPVPSGPCSYLRAAGRDQSQGALEATRRLQHLEVMLRVLALPREHRTAGSKRPRPSSSAAASPVAAAAAGAPPLAPPLATVAPSPPPSWFDAELWRISPEALCGRQPWRRALQRDSLIAVLYSDGLVYQAKVTDRAADRRLRLRYTGWEASMDEWVAVHDPRLLSVWPPPAGVTLAGEDNGTGLSAVRIDMSLPGPRAGAPSAAQPGGSEPVVAAAVAPAAVPHQRTTPPAAATAAGSHSPWRRALQRDSLIAVLYSDGLVYQAKVTDRAADRRLRLHYTGWEASMDEWVAVHDPRLLSAWPPPAGVTLAGEDNGTGLSAVRIDVPAGARLFKGDC